METPRRVHCQKLKKEAPGLTKPPFPGELGEKIFNNISQEAWNQWLNQQTLLINEHRLSLIDPKARTFLQNQMQKFLFEENYTPPEGYIAPN